MFIPFKQTFTVHPVGQGLFYTGAIQFNGQEFRFVYDCGTSNEESLVDNAVANSYLYHWVEIDMLVISHFDKDHINCIRRLLDRNNKKLGVKKVVLPFLSKEERILFACIYALETENVDIEVIRIILQPESAFPGAEIIYVIGGNSSFATDSNDNEGGPEIDAEGILSVAVQLSGQAPNPFPPEGSENSDVSTMDHKEPIRVKVGKTDVTQFIFYRQNARDKLKIEYDELLVAIGNALPASGLNSAEAIIETLKKGEAEKLKEFISKVLDSESFMPRKNKTRFSQAAIYNSFAMPMMHRLILNLRTAKAHYYVRYQVWGPRINFNTHLRELNFCNTLLTSDIPLKILTDIKAFKDHFASVWDEFRLFQAPHHGSKENSSNSLYQEMDESVRYFINHGFMYNHPNLDQTHSFELAQAREVTGDPSSKLEHRIQIIIET